MRAALDAIAASAPDAETLRADALALLAETLDEGRRRVHAAFAERPAGGLRTARSLAHVTDVVVAGAAHVATVHLHPAPVRTRAERLAVAAVGGYGRGEMAPFSDVDLLFLTPYKRTAWTESVIESVLYLLWDLQAQGRPVGALDRATACASPAAI